MAVVLDPAPQRTVGQWPRDLSTPVLHLDVDIAVARYTALAAALPGTAIHYAVKANPDAVLLLPSGQGGLAEQIKASKAWAEVPAVKQGRVVDLDTTLFLRAPGPRAGEALEKLVALLWP
jgi:ABC-type Fe3+-hydroxamate transport system substrate-binding protein